jgi:anti-sigma regulatory factor (Ser/Thr protein kinase)
MTPPRFHMRFPCNRKYAARARRSFTAYLAGAGIDSRVQVELESAVGEAIANAIEHGYPKARWFEIRCEIRDDEVVVEVEDDGVGFQADPTQPPPGHVRGFGFGIMRSLVDELHILKNGRLIRFTKLLPGPTQAEVTSSLALRRTATNDAKKIVAAGHSRAKSSPAQATPRPSPIQ